MKPIKFKQANVNFAENQEEYGTLPAFKSNDGMWVEGGTLKQNKDMEEKTWFEVRVKAR